MGIRNYLIEGVSCAGKTAVCHALRRRGYHALSGDRDLAYQGDPTSGERVARPVGLSEADAVAWVHSHNIWDVEKVRALIADRSDPLSFFCGGSRNFAQFIHLFDGVFILDIDGETLERRLALRPRDEFGGRPSERALIRRLHATKEDTPRQGVSVDAAAPLDRVVEEILAQCERLAGARQSGHMAVSGPQSG